MLKLIITEVNYNIALLSFIAIITVIVTMFALLDFTFLLHDKPAEIVFWSLILYLGVYSSLAMIWYMIIKEKRSRLILLLPFPYGVFSTVYIMITLIPVLFITLLSVSLEFVVMEEWLQFTNRMFASMGMVILFGGSFLIIRNLLFSFSIRNLKYRETILIGTVLIIISVAAALDIYFYNAFGSIIYYAWGTILLFVAHTIFLKRNSFLC